MKLSNILHKSTIFLSALGILSLVSAWFVGSGGNVLGMTESHLFQDTFAFLLLAILMQVATIHHLQLEKNEIK